MTEKPFITSGRNTIIHKIRKLDLLVINGDEHPPIIVTYKGILSEFSIGNNDYGSTLTVMLMNK